MKKWEDGKYLVSLLCVWLEGWKSRMMENSFVWLERKREG